MSSFREKAHRFIFFYSGHFKIFQWARFILWVGNSTNATALVRTCRKGTRLKKNGRGTIVFYCLWPQTVEDATVLAFTKPCFLSPNSCAVVFMCVRESVLDSRNKFLWRTRSEYADGGGSFHRLLSLSSLHASPGRDAQKGLALGHLEDQHCCMLSSIPPHH